MRTRAHHRAGAVALAGLAVLAVGAAAPASGAEQPTPDRPSVTERAPASEKKQPKAAKDVTAPARPTLGEVSTGPGGTVTLPVQAESGSALVVREGTEVVASASALGVSQSLAWRTGTGPHTYLVVASDAAGNVSDSASVTLEVDATPPSADRFTVTAGTARDSRSSWSVVTDPGTTYELVVNDKTVSDGTTEGRHVEEQLALADGSHDVRLELRDEAGNVRTLSERVTVDIPELWVVAKDVSAANATERSIKVAAAPGTRGFLRIPGGATARFQLPEGRAHVTVEVPEGSFSAPVVIVADSRDRKGHVELAPFEVDLTAPSLRVVGDEPAAERGLLRATVAAGAGDTVVWRLVDERGVAVLSGQYVADGTAHPLERRVAEGGYELEVTATDTHGNKSAEQLTATVAALPIINPDVVPALAITLALWVLVGIAAFLRRRSRRLHGVAGRTGARRTVAGGPVAGGRALRSSRARMIAEHEAASAAYEEQLADFQREDRAWQRRRDALAQLVTVAQGGQVELPEIAVVLRPGERAFCSLPAWLVEMRQRDGVEVPVEVEEGRMVVTDTRVVFCGARNRDWELAKLEQLRHVGPDRTLMTVSNRKTVSGVSYEDADLVRFYLELAVADLEGSGRSIRTMLEQGVRSHELRRPQPPMPVGPAPSGRRFGRLPANLIGGRPVAAVEALVDEQAPAVTPDAPEAVTLVVQPTVATAVDRSTERELVLQG